jgi:hypothetical protein
MTGALHAMLPCCLQTKLLCTEGLLWAWRDIPCRHCCFDLSGPAACGAGWSHGSLSICTVEYIFCCHWFSMPAVLYSMPLHCLTVHSAC